MTAVLEKGAQFRFLARGFSMSPFIQDGDAITIVSVKIPSAKIDRGDVVAFLNPCCNKLAVHRVIHISRDGYLIKGDNSSEPDGRVSDSRILGRVVRVERRGRKVNLGLGIERIAIAFLSRRGWLTQLIGSMGNVWRFIKPFAGSWIK
ncbi:MAG: S26 family signal peptidase [Deltaproteobacteria bacterium]